MRSAFVRSLRTAAQTLAGALIAFPTIDTVTQIREIGNPFIVALYTAFMAGLVSFLQNAVEDTAGVSGNVKG